MTAGGSCSGGSGGTSSVPTTRRGDGNVCLCFASGGVPLGWSLHPGDGSNACPEAQKFVQNPFSETWPRAVLSVVGQKFE